MRPLNRRSRRRQIRLSGSRLCRYIDPSSHVVRLDIRLVDGRLPLAVSIDNGPDDEEGYEGDEEDRGDAGEYQS